jgi:hypothetical protein
MKDANGYIRVSSEEQADSGLGLEAQRESAEVFEDRRPPGSVLLYPN